MNRIKYPYRMYSRLLIGFFLMLPAMLVSAQSASQESMTTGRQVPAVESERWFENEYKEGAAYWKSIVEQNTSNEEAWLSWYKSTRYSNYSAHSKVISQESQQSLNAIITQMQEAVPASFALQYASYLNGNKSEKSFVHLEQAITMHPEEIEIFDDMVAMGIIRENAAQTQLYCSKLKASNTFNASEVEYNRNVMNSIEPNAVLLTNGNVDTYPIIMDQQLSAYRTDITVVCLDWLYNEKYATRIAKLLGIAPSALKGKTPFKALDEILTPKTKVPVYLALTIPPKQIDHFKKDLFITGLAMKYSPLPIENISSLVYNWENLFQKTQIGSISEINRNYLFPLIHLYTFYEQQGATEKSKEIRGYILMLAQLTGQEEKIQQLVD